MRTVQKNANGRCMMRSNRLRDKARENGNFILCLLINMLLNLHGLIPAVALLILHFVFGLPLWCAFLAAALWIAGLIIWMLIIGWAGNCSNTPDPPKENKNPYSSGNHQNK